MNKIHKLNSLRRKRIKTLLQMIRKEKRREFKHPSIQRIQYPLITNNPISEEEQIRLLNNDKFIESLPKHQVNTSSIQNHLEKKKIKMVTIQDNNNNNTSNQEDIYLDKIPICPYPKIEELSEYNINEEKEDNKEKVDDATKDFPENINIPKKIENFFQLKREGPKVQVFGAFNTGTNLMVKLLNNLFETQIPKEGSTRKWKHTLNVKNFPRLFHICMIKNPFSWFQSVIKESYLIEWDKKKRLLHQPVLMRGEGNPQRFSSIAKLWLHYYISYLEFSKKNKYNVLVIPFEEMIYDTDNLYQFVSNVFKIPLPTNYNEIKEKTMARPAKPHGHCNTLNQVKEKTKLEFLFSKYTKEDVMRFFQDVPLHLILPKHRYLWKLDDWFNHFITRPEVSNAPSIHP